MSDSTQIAKTILSQISVNTQMACGFRNLVAGNGDDFHLRCEGRASGKRWVEITLNAKDLYDIAFIRVSRMSRVVISTHTDVYAEELSETVYRLFNR